MTHPARVVFDRSALLHNLSCIKALAPASKTIAVVKADAYGHGLERVALLLEDTDAFGVACLEEALRLRAVKIMCPIVILEGPYTIDDIDMANRYGFELVVHSQFQIEMLTRYSSLLAAPIWIKVDTGMHRLGFQPAQVQSVFDRIRVLHPSVCIRLMTHFASANTPKDSLNLYQRECFAGINLEVERSAANSAAILAMPETHLDWIRPGLMLYGVSPFPDTMSAEHGLRPVMSFESELIAIQRLKKGDSVGYGAAWRCPEDIPVGIVSAGYGDGYPRLAKSGTPILINGVRAGLVGNPSMGMLAVDLRVCPEARVGDAVVLWGKGLPVEEIARAAGTIPYDVLCGVHQRLRFVGSGEI